MRVAPERPERPAVDKLHAKEVLVPDIKAAEDLNLWPFATSPTAFWTLSMQHAPHQPSDLTLTKLIVLSIRQRKPKTNEPVAAVIVQVMGNFVPKVF